MVQDVKLIGHWNSRSLQFGDRADDAAVGHVARRIVVGANNKDSLMLATRRLNKVVQLQEVVVITGQEDKTLLRGVFEVTSVGRSGHGRVGRNQHAMADLAQRDDQLSLRAVVIQVKVHFSGL